MNMLSGDVLQTKRSHPIRHVLRLHGFCNSSWMALNHSSPKMFQSRSHRFSKK